MPHTIISLALIALTVYLALGFVFALAFVIRGAPAIDPVARTTPMHVRIILFPGAAVLWPMLLTRWISTPEPAPEQD